MSFSYQCYRFIWDKHLVPARFTRSVYKRLSKLGPAPDSPFVQDFYGLQYYGNLTNNIDFNIYFYGAFEKPLLYFLRDTLSRLNKDKAIFVDIGANVGQHSLFMAAHGAQVHSFEPFDRVRNQLQMQIDKNALTSITVHPLGLSNENTRLPFFAPTGNNAGIGSFDASTTSKGNVSIGELELVKGDDYLAAQSITTIDIMKMDVEGFEKFAIEGLQKSLSDTRPIIVCEITYGQSLSFESLEQLENALPENYKLFTFNKRKADGSKDRRRDALSRHSGDYSIIALTQFLSSGQDDVIACPTEKCDLLPMHNIDRP